MKTAAAPFKSAEALNKAFLKLKKHDGLSLRQWAEMSSLSASYLNLVLNSKRLPPKKTLRLLGQSLGLDELSLHALLELHEEDWFKQKGLTTKPSTEKAEKIQAVYEVAEEDSALLRSWLHLGLLEYSGCEGFTEDATVLARKFSVAVNDARQALGDLVRSGFLQRDESGALVKSHLKMRLPTLRSREVVRDFHVRSLKKAISHLQKNTDQEAFEKRLITGYTVAVAPDKVEEAKRLMQEAMIDIASRLCSGNCTEVYQLQVQMFPLTTKK